MSANLFYNLNRFINEFLSGKAQSYGIIPVRKAGNNYLFLIIQHNTGHWDFPKGHPETDESPQQTAAREFQEETGIKGFKLISDISLAEEYSFKLAGKTIIKKVRYFLAIVKDNKVQIQAGEVNDYRWVSYQDGLKLITYPAGKKLLKKAQSFISISSL